MKKNSSQRALSIKWNPDLNFPSLTDPKNKTPIKLVK